MAGQWEFMRKSVDAMKDVLDAYDFHRYASWEETTNHGLPGTWESLWSHLDLWRGEVPKPVDRASERRAHPASKQPRPAEQNLTLGAYARSSADSSSRR